MRSTRSESQGQGTTERRTRLGWLLLANGLVTEEQLEEALATQQRTGQRLGDVLVDAGVISNFDLTRMLALHFDLSFIDLDDSMVDASVQGLLPVSVARRNLALPVARNDDRVVVAVADPSDVFAIDDIRSLVGGELELVLVERGQLARALDRVFGPVARDDAQTTDGAAEKGDTHVADTDITPTPTAIVEFVDRVLAEANELGASDVHFEPMSDGLRVRFRVDGVLHDRATAPQSFRALVVGCLEAMADLPRGSKLPQVATLTRTLPPERGREVELEVVTLPAMGGTAAAVHFSDGPRATLEIDALGLPTRAQVQFEEALRTPEGVIVVVGPRGSGLSTTLHAALRVVNGRDRNVVTVEGRVSDPVEGVKQLVVDRDAGLTVLAALRAARQADPDVVMVDPLDGPETTALAFDTALVGPQVLASLIGDRAATTPRRLVDSGLDPFVVGTTLRCIVAQRILRLLCADCTEPYRPNLDSLFDIGWPESLLDGGSAPTLRRPAGCPRCRHTGYRGRFAIFEVLQVTPSIAEAVLGGVPAAELEETARAAGMEPLRAGAFRAVAAGTTSLAELLRVAV